MATVTKTKPSHPLVQVDIKKILAAGAIKTVTLNKEEELEELLRAQERQERKCRMS